MAARGPAEGALPSAERRTVTVVCAEVGGSRELLEEIGAAEARAVIEPALERIRSCARRYEGHVAEAAGEGIVAVFGAPVAHEDHPQRALYAALAMQEEIRAYARQLRLERGVSLDVRAGVHTGEVMVLTGVDGHDSPASVPQGDTARIGQRLRALASPGTVVASEATRGLCEGRFRFRPLGPAKIDGAGPPVELHAVAGMGRERSRLEAAERRGLTRFVGRKEELSQLSHALELARAGQGQIVTVSGEAGVGKSRLLYEFRRSIPDGTLLLETFAAPHEKSSPYRPVVELLRTHLRIGARDEESERREKVTARLLALDRSLKSVLPYLFPLLEIADPSAATLAQMDAEIRRRRTHAALERILLAETVTQPVVMLVEDLHWLDAESEAVVEELAEGLGAARFLLVVTSRPGHDERGLARTYTTRLRLDPLPPPGADELLAALLGTDPALDSLKRQATGRAEGNPFFLEEIVRELFEKGVLEREGGVRIAKPAEHLRLPATVEGVLAARIDRLSPTEKELLQVGAVLGRTFTASLAAATSERGEDEVREVLSHLRRAEIVYERPALPEPEHTFKHALTREVAYESIPAETRQSLHERAARAIETIYASRLQPHYGDLAYHYVRSSNAAKAIEYLHSAGTQALERSAYPEAIHRFTTALDLLRTMADTEDRTALELDLQVALGLALTAHRGFGAPEVEATYARASELGRQMGDRPRLFAVLWGLWAFRSVSAKHRESRELSEELLSLAQATQDPGLLLESHVSLAHTCHDLGDFIASRRHAEEGIAIYDRWRHHSLTTAFPGADAGVALLSGPAIASWSLGYPAQALKRSAEALDLARDLSHPISQMYAFGHGARLHQLCGYGQTVRELAEATIAVSSEFGLRMGLGFGIAMRGWALADQGQVEAGIAQLREGIAAFRATGAETWRPYLLFLLADALGKGRQAKEGLDVVREALAVVNDTGERMIEAELHRLQGVLVLRSGGDDPDHDTRGRAEACFRKATEIAREQNARSLELRAVTCLGRLLRQRGAAGEARDMLERTYGWFTEGFDTPDLREARTLLDELYRTATSAAAPSASPAAGDSDPWADGSPALFRREGDFWTIAYSGKTLRLKDTKGLRQLAVLLTSPDRDFHPIELALAGDGGDPGAAVLQTGRRRALADARLAGANSSAGDEILDARAKAEYRRRLADLESELEEARRFNDTGRTERLEQELDAIQGALASALGLGGRDRRSATAAERARVNLTKAIRTSIARIAREHAELGRHLDATIRTGRLFSYTPDPRAPLAWSG